MKKQYITPTIEAINLQPQNQLLAVSTDENGVNKNTVSDEVDSAW